jgi:uroporphyrinogen III methyltransferase/synthase
MPDGLRGKRVLVTRATGQNTELSRQLTSVGAVPVEFPTIQIGPPADPTPLNTTIANLGNYQWLILTSANGVKYFWQHLLAAGRDKTHLQHLRIAAIGPATAAEISARGLTIDVMPAKHVAEMLVAEMPAIIGQRMLLPTANIARDALVDGLAAKGASVERVTAYQNTPVTDPGDLLNLLPTLDALTFTSASTALNFANLLQPENPAAAIGPAIVACVGPITANAAIDAGLPIHVVAQTYTIPGLVAALQIYYQTKTTHYAPRTTPYVA